MFGGEAQQWLKNALGLAWTGPGQLLFSEIMMGVHSDGCRGQTRTIGQRDVYVPTAEPDMAHRSYLPGGSVT